MQKVVLNATGDFGYIISIKKSIQNFLSKPEGESIEKQTDLCIFDTNSNLLPSTFAFQQSIYLSKLSKKRNAPFNMLTRSVLFIEIVDTHQGRAKSERSSTEKN